MNNVEAAPAAAGVAAPMVVPSEPVSIVVDEKLMVVLNKDGGVESMEVNGGMALQVVLPTMCIEPCIMDLEPGTPSSMKFEGC